MSNESSPQILSDTICVLRRQLHKSLCTRDCRPLSCTLPRIVLSSADIFRRQQFPRVYFVCHILGTPSYPNRKSSRSGAHKLSRCTAPLTPWKISVRSSWRFVRMSLCVYLIGNAVTSHSSNHTHTHTHCFSIGFLVHFYVSKR